MGLRPSEFVAIRWEHVDFVRGVVLVPKGKTANARREVEFSSRVREMLIRRAGNGSTFVFPSTRRKERHVSSNSVTQSFKRYKQELGLDDRLVLYSGRHTFATDFLGETGNLDKLKKVMGHSSITITQRYLHSDTNDTGSVMDQRNARRMDSVATEGRVM
jgi:integrase